MLKCMAPAEHYDYEIKYIHYSYENKESIEICPKLKIWVLCNRIYYVGLN